MILDVVTNHEDSSVPVSSDLITHMFTKKWCSHKCVKVREQIPVAKASLSWDQISRPSHGYVECKLATSWHMSAFRLPRRSMSHCRTLSLGCRLNHSTWLRPQLPGRHCISSSSVPAVRVVANTNFDYQQPNSIQCQVFLIPFKPPLTSTNYS